MCLSDGLRRIIKTNHAVSSLSMSRPGEGQGTRIVVDQESGEEEEGEGEEGRPENC